MVAKQSDSETPTVDPTIAEGDAVEVTSNYQNYLLPEANNGQGRAVKARTKAEAIAKAAKLDKENEGVK